MSPEVPAPVSIGPTSERPSKSRQPDANGRESRRAPGNIESVRACVRSLARWLPEQRPLSVFVHANPLGALEGEHFHAACEAATRIRGARTTLSRARYRELVEQKHIRPEDVAAARARIATLELRRIDELPEPGPRTVLLSRVRPEMASEVGEMVDAVLLRVLPAFLDLGSALWPMPKRNDGLLAVLRHLSRTPLGMPEPWLRGLTQRLGDAKTDHSELLLSCLEKRGDAATGWPNLIHEAMFALPGYAGMIHRLEHYASERPKETHVSLEEYLTARLVIEELALSDIARRLFGRRATIDQLASSVERPLRADAPVWTEELGALQDAFEEDYVRSLVGAMHVAAIHRSEARRPRVSRPNVHFVCCIDDRLESVRRHIEECVPDVETVGSAGFFGIALKHRAPLDVDETPSCPAPITPEKRVTEALGDDAARALQRRRFWSRALGLSAGDDASRFAFGGVLASAASLLHAPRNLVELVFPQLFVTPARDFEGSRLVYAKEHDAEGFTLEDQITLVHRNLATIGLTSGFGRWVLIVGHGSQGRNNPFLSGYQCGACGGQRGGINARVFCAFANDPKVRAGLAEKGLVISDETHFLPGEHDTSLDHIRWFDLETLSDARRSELDEIRRCLGIALARNAKERTRRFADVPLEAPIEEAHAYAQRRTADFAETRPEYNHATNASCIIGRRALTRGLFLDRRAFLVSYDPETDDARHGTLERLMAAPLPVCAGISHEYFFATMDPEKMGSGTKLPHNVQGLLGVSNGADGDLRPGLWTQTTEIHDAIRLVTVIEAEPEVISEVLDRLPDVKRTACNGWIHLFACSPKGRGFFRWVGQRFEPYVALPHALDEVASSLEACAHTRGHVAPCLVVTDEDDGARGSEAVA